MNDFVLSLSWDKIDANVTSCPVCSGPDLVKVNMDRYFQIHCDNGTNHDCFYLLISAPSGWSKITWECIDLDNRKQNDYLIINTLLNICEKNQPPKLNQLLNDKMKLMLTFL